MVCSPYRVVALRLVVAIASMAIAGCGEPGAPQPPSLNLPVPIHDLAATRTADAVHLTWTSATRTTDRAPLAGTIRTRICRMEGDGPCTVVTEQPLKPGQPEQFDDALPPAQLQGPPQLLTYYVELLNHAQKSAGRSNAAYSASGQSAPALVSLSATVRPEGVELHWGPLEWPANGGSGDLIRITRLDQSPPKPKQASSSGTKSMLAPASTTLSPLQTLEVAAGERASATGEALDRSALFGESYRYEARCVEKLVLEGHPLELTGALSAPAAVLTKDIFPPAVPQQLAAAGDAASQGIDLSWAPDSEPDLAGYVVYRRPASGSASAERISGAAPVASPSFHDAHVTPDTAYAYSVSSVDTSGNESALSPEAQETLSSPH